jgi:exodeoxyribonuclease VII large subunit
MVDAAAIGGEAVPAVSNAPEWSVSELSQALKRTIEESYGYVRVRGEISGYRGPHSSGHAYFALKDKDAKIEAVIWRGTFARLKTKPEEGLEVIAHGKVTTFPGKSSYQIVIDRLEPAGVGALMALLEERRRRLAAEGLFDEARKVPLPHLPTVIGVVTSPTGAVIRDILHRLEDRFPRRVILWPVRVQGETAAAEVAAAIRGFDALPAGGAIPRPDVVIVARGGGSLEDLWSFNEEVVVRAVAASSIPIVSAVGHETDWTLIDHVADRRAPTPTGAAEMVVPVRSQLLAVAADLVGRLAAAASRSMERRRADLRAMGRALPSAEALLAGPRQRVDIAAGRLTQSLILNVRRHQQRYEGICRRLTVRDPKARLEAARHRLDLFGERLDQAARASVRRRRDGYLGAASRLAPVLLARRAEAGRERLGGAAGRFVAAAMAGTTRRREALLRMSSLLQAYSYQGVLERGFALVRDLDDRPVRDSATARAAVRLDIQFADGRVRVRTDDAAEPAAPARPRPAPRPAKAEREAPVRQRSLFDP